MFMVMPEAGGAFSGVVPVIVEVCVTKTELEFQVPVAPHIPLVTIAEPESGSVSLIPVIVQFLKYAERKFQIAEIIFPVKGMYTEEMAVEGFVYPESHLRLN